MFKDIYERSTEKIKAYKYNKEDKIEDEIGCKIQTNPLSSRCPKINEIGCTCEGCKLYLPYFFNNTMKTPLFIEPEKEYYIIEDGNSRYPMEEKAFLSLYNRVKNDEDDFFKSKQKRSTTKKGLIRSLNIESKQYIKSRHSKLFEHACNQPSKYVDDYCPFAHNCKECTNYQPYILVNKKKIFLEDKIYIIKIVDTDTTILLDEYTYRKLVVEL